MTSSSCDPSCQTCLGGGANQCLTCPSGKYFYAGNNSCLSCNVDGYSHTDGVNCIQCDSTCSTCSGSRATNCLTCASGLYLYSLNSSCVTCFADGVYISGNGCLKCDSSCKSCSGPTPTDCLTCYSEDTLTSQRSCISSETKLDSTQAVIVTKTSTVASASGQSQDAATSILPLLSKGASTTVILLAEFTGDIILYRYINIKFPHNFVEFCHSLEHHFIPNPFTNIGCHESQLGKFKEFDMSTCFLKNAGHLLNKEVVALCLIAASWILSWLLQSHARISKALISIRTVLTWNSFISYFMGDFKEFVLYSMLDIFPSSSSSSSLSSNEHRLLSGSAGSSETDESHIKGGTVGPRFSYAISIITIVIYAVMFFYFGYLLNRKKKKNPASDVTSPSTRKILPEQNKHEESPSHNHHNHAEGKEKSKWMEVPRAFDAISSELKKDTLFSRNFLLFLQLSSLLTGLNFLFLQDYGVVQAAIYFAINLIFMILVLYYKPFEHKLELWLFTINFISRLFMGFFAILIGARPDKLSTNAIGLTLIVLTVTTTVINSLVSVWLILKMLIGFCKKRFGRANKNRTHPLPQPDRMAVADIEVFPSLPNTTRIDSSKPSSRRNLFTEREVSSLQFVHLKSKSQDLELDTERSHYVQGNQSPSTRRNTETPFELEAHKVLIRPSEACSHLNLNTPSQNQDFQITLDALTDISPVKVSHNFLWGAREISLSKEGGLNEEASRDKDISPDLKLALNEKNNHEKKLDIIDQLKMIVEDADSETEKNQK